jgi:hypothetical protein
VLEDAAPGSAEPAKVGIVINENLLITDDGNDNAFLENNDVSEYLSRVDLLETSAILLNFIDTLTVLNIAVPAVSSGTQTETNLGTNGFGILEYDLDTNSFSITSSVIEDAKAAGTLGLLEAADLQMSEDDIRQILQAFVAVPAVQHSDVNAMVEFNATTIDVNPDLDEADENTCTRLHIVVIRADVDPVALNVTQPPEGTYLEDGAPIPLIISVESSADNLDNSEYLEIEITVPYDSAYFGLIGTVTYTGVDSRITLSDEGNGVWKLTLPNTMTAQEQETLLNAELASNLFFVPGENWAGNLPATEAGIKVELFSIEEAFGDEVENKEISAFQYIGIDIFPVVSINYGESGVKIFERLPMSKTRCLFSPPSRMNRLLLSRVMRAGQRMSRLAFPSVSELKTRTLKHMS